MNEGKKRHGHTVKTGPLDPRTPGPLGPLDP